MTTNHSLLFLGGAGLPAWIWDDVRRELEHELGTDTVMTVAPRPTNAAGLRDYAEAAIQAVETDGFTIVCTKEPTKNTMHLPAPRRQTS